MKTITGTFVNSQNSHITPTTGAGLTLSLQLKTPANASGVGLVTSTPILITLTAAAIPGATQILATDELTPATNYVCKVVDISNNVIWGPVTLAISGASPIDLSTLTPV